MFDYFTRYKIYFFTVIALAVCFAVLGFLLYFLAPGFNVEAKLSLEGAPQVNLLLENSSSHVVNNVVVLVNKKEFKKIDSFPANSTLTLVIPVLDDVTINVTAERHSSFEKTFTLKTASADFDTITYGLNYNFGKLNENTDVNLKICSTINDEQQLGVAILQDGVLESGAEATTLILPSKDCETISYIVKYKVGGYKKIKFKITKDIYVKELLISGIVG